MHMNPGGTPLRLCLLLAALVSAVMICSCAGPGGSAAPDPAVAEQSVREEPVAESPADEAVTASAAEKTADQPEPAVFTLDDCLRIALKESPSLDNAIKSIEGAEWTKKQAFTAFLPTVGAQYQYTRLDDVPMQSGWTLPLPAPIGPITIPATQVGTRDNYQATLTVTQPIFTGLTNLTNYKLAKLGLDMAAIAKDQAVMDLVLDVKKAYFGVLQVLKGLEVAQQSVKQLEGHLKVARSFFEVGMVPKNHVLQAEVRMAEAVQTLIETEHRLMFAKANLNTLLRRRIQADIAVEDILCRGPFDLTLDECIKRALKHRPEVQAAQRQIQMKDLEVSRAQAGYYPSVAVMYNRIKKGDTWKVEGGDYHEGDSWNVVAAASWSIFEWGRTRDGVQVSRVEHAKAKNVLVQVNDGVQLEVEQNFLALRAAMKNIVVAEKAVEQAEENYRMSNERYREQVATSTEVMDAETLLTSARTNYYNALYSFCLARASLERAMGMRQAAAK